LKFFLFYSALYLGPNTHLLSNDNFVDHIGSSHFLPEIAPLFKIWRETRCISFIPEETGEEKFLKVDIKIYFGSPQLSRDSTEYRTL